MARPATYTLARLSLTDKLALAGALAACTTYTLETDFIIVEIADEVSGVLLFAQSLKAAPGGITARFRRAATARGIEVKNDLIDIFSRVEISLLAVVFLFWSLVHTPDFMGKVPLTSRRAKFISPYAILQRGVRKIHE